MGTALAIPGSRKRYRTGKKPLPSRNRANILPILEVRMHIKGSGQDADGRIKKIFAPPDVAGVLEAEFRSQRGKVMVSRENPSNPLRGELTSKCARLPISAMLPACTCSGGWRSGSTSSS